MAIVVLVTAIALASIIGTTSGGASDTTQFLGRFHPSIVHMPIGVLVLAVFLEVISLWPRMRIRIDGAIGPVLLFAAGSALASFTLGMLLATSGGFPTHIVSLHRWFAFGSVASTALCVAVWSLQDESRTGKKRNIYRGALALTLGLISIGGHLGGTIRRGDGYLTRFAPEWVQSITGTKPAPIVVTAPPVAGKDARLFESAVLPILRDRCVDCHGPETTSGNLRLDTLAEINKGGEHGVVLAPFSAEKSPLVRRMELPLTHDERMPPDGKPGPSAEEIQVIRFWIDRGAREDQTIADALSPESAKVVLAKALGAAAAAKPTPTPTGTTTATPTAPTAPTAAP